MFISIQKIKKNIDITNKPQEIAKSIFDGKNSFRSIKKVAKAHIIIQYEYALQSLFLLYSFIGYIAEVISVSITHKRVVWNRGFLIGPYLPIYGVGALIMIWFLSRYEDDLLAALLGNYLG